MVFQRDDDIVSMTVLYTMHDMLYLFRESMGAPPSLFYNIPCRENIESLLQHHLATAAGGYPNAVSMSPKNFCNDAELDEAIKAQLCNVRHQGMF